MRIHTTSHFVDKQRHGSTFKSQKKLKYLFVSAAEHPELSQSEIRFSGSIVCTGQNLRKVIPRDPICVFKPVCSEGLHKAFYSLCL